MRHSAPVISCALFTLFSGISLQAQDAPAWWTDGNPPVVNENTENNKGPASIGQAKYMVKEALRGLAAVESTVAQQIEDDLAGTEPDNSDRIVDLELPGTITDEWRAQQKQVLNIGQLKALADPFYTRLDAHNTVWLADQRTLNGTNHAGSIFPWTSDTADDNNKGIASIGQLKATFSLRFDTVGPPTNEDTDGDGIIDSEDPHPNDYYK